jgi:uncharacterized membrane protein
MNRKQFMETLKSNLKGISREDKKEILEDYEEHFKIGKKKKRKESEIAKALGNPKQIAKQAKVELAVEKAQDKLNFKNVTRAVFAIMGMGFFNLVFMIGPFFGLLGVLIGLLATGFALTISGIAVIIAGVLAPFMTEFIILGGLSMSMIILAGIGLTSFGALFLIGTWYSSKGFYKITLKYVKFNLKIIKGEKK